MNKTAKLLGALFLAILSLTVLSCSSLKSSETQTGEKKLETQIAEKKKDVVNLPNNTQSGEEDSDVMKDTSMIIAVAADKNIYQGEERISKEQLTERLKKFVETKSEDKRIVYLKGDIDAAPETLVDILKTIRDAKIYKVALVINKASNPRPNVFEIVLPPDPSKEANKILKPNPLTLVVFGVGNSDKLLLNWEETGSISDTDPLKTKLMSIFKDREKNGVLVEGTNEVEKTVFVETSKINKYGNVVKVIDALKVAGAKPIKWDIDGLKSDIDEEKVPEINGIPEEPKSKSEVLKDEPPPPMKSTPLKKPTP